MLDRTKAIMNGAGDRGQNIPQQPLTVLNSLRYDPKLPFSSPDPDDQRSVRSVNSGKTYLSRNPFISPDPSQTPSVGEESDSTSGLDEFHLERYSQASRPNKSSETRGNIRVENRGYTRAESPSKKTRPGLNIITNFASNSNRAFSDGVIVDNVHANRPRLGHRSITSIKSSKVEHGYQDLSPPPPPNPGFVSLGDIIGLVQKKQKKTKTDSRRDIKTRKAMEDSQREDRQDQHISPAARSILIGISVPKDEVAAHQPKPGDSALDMHTPRTPSILVTPANNDSPWLLQQGGTVRHKRPASSVYSQAILGDRAYMPDAEAPPLPILSHAHGLMWEAKSPAVGDDPVHDHRESRGSFETVFDDDSNSIEKSQRRASSESQEQILPASGDTERPQSTGWWNLALSPMMSRAATLIGKKSPATNMKKDFTSSLQNRQREAAKATGSASPPDLPRGLAIDHNEKSETIESRMNLRREQPIDKTNDDLASQTLDPYGLNAVGFNQQSHGPLASSGLAAEYFHACAIESVCGGQYFECIGHSCAERLPDLGFVPMKEASRDQLDVDPKTPLLRSGVEDDLDERSPEFSPNVRRANAAPIMKAKAIQKAVDCTPPASGSSEGVDEDQPESTPGWPLQTKSSALPAYSPPRPANTLPSISTVLHVQQPPVLSPGPMTPAMRQAMAPAGAMPLASVTRPAASHGAFFTHDTSYPNTSPRPNRPPVSLRDIDPPTEVQEKGEAKRRRLEKEDAAGRKVGGLWRGRGCLPKNGCFGREGPEGRKKRRLHLLICAILLAIVITCVALATLLTRKGTATPIESRWLNLTGFPPMPTGISTIVRPDAQVEDTGCVQPSAVWSCAVPKEDQESITPNDADQPNFRFEITFRNGTVPAGETIPLGTRSLQASRLFSTNRLDSRANDPFTNDLFKPSPAAPNLKEQSFLGNTTDNVTAPFEGEETPFFITFISTTPVVPSAFNDSSPSSSLQRRQSANGSNSITDAIPPPEKAPDGTAAAANLLPDAPFPFSQPIRLYNRGLTTEHYGFYTYFDRSIFLSSAIALNATDALSDVGNLPGNGNGGSPKAEASLRCTWAQTRFLVKIWTDPSFGGTLIGPRFDVDHPPKGNNSATFFSTPGSFPYPVTVTLDRHGGDVNKKGVYCYGMDGVQHILDDDKALILEERASGGIAINPAPPLIQIQGVSDGFDPNAGGIDGGTGGCECTWQNWIGSGN